MTREWTQADAARFVRAPSADDDKYSRGVVALRTGSAEYPGAAVLGVEAAWRAGAGYVRYLGGAPDAVLARRPETVAGDELGRTRVGAWVIGSGSDAAQRSAAESAALRQVLGGEAPVVVDAGALDLVEGAAAPLVLTPHDRELARLRDRLGADPVPDSAERRVAEAVQVARMLQAVVLRKGARTIIAAPDDEPLVVANGPAWLSTAGTGDVLAGVLGAVLAANPRAPRNEAAAAAAWLHGLAARIASGARGDAPGHPIVALDVAAALPRAIEELVTGTQSGTGRAESTGRP
ncbi:ADP/ATP-dependent (S)-NAD(P)H-hydrate dehydratase [Microbacterium sp. ARD32]|uniref:ADP-dependent NAD(P)H-hydrate dehydratase n=1 Tax=Microbacterium sp. ARD32 TaxID=2962577 RepID=UPI002881EB57|nr:ADP/ATP-dependent (S)-NAD(P)H-hydrate dehydratase [Microbacterium sp. ARD32]MDT0156820.1 ADP/ATP-dependent (S)-NAD(P)H-hydrate dehydratase [Microbacterium sp. ARD32]